MSFFDGIKNFCSGIVSSVEGFLNLGNDISGLTQDAAALTQDIGVMTDTFQQVGAYFGVIAFTTHILESNVSTLIEDIDNEMIMNHDTKKPGELVSLISDIDSLLVEKRLTPRDVSELWPSELEQLQAIKSEIPITKMNISTALAEGWPVVNTLRMATNNLPPLTNPAGQASFIPIDFFLKEIMDNYDLRNMDKNINDINNFLSILKNTNVDQPTFSTINQMCSELKQYADMYNKNSNYLDALNEGHDNILYTEPGLISVSIYNANEVLEHISTIDLPKIDDILDSVDKSAGEVAEILDQVNQLFVTTKLVPVPAAQIPASQLPMKGWLENSYAQLASSIAKEYTTSSELASIVSGLHSEVDDASAVAINQKVLAKTAVDGGS